MEITSEPFRPRLVLRAVDSLKAQPALPDLDFPSTDKLVSIARRPNLESKRLADLFYRNAVLVVFPR